MLKRVNIGYFPRSQGFIYAAFWSLSETKWRSKYACATPQCAIEVLKKNCVNIYFASNIKYVSSCLKGFILTIFRGRTNRHLRGVLSISRDETAVYIWLYYYMMWPKAFYRTALITFMPQYIIYLISCFKRFVLTIFRGRRLCGVLSNSRGETAVYVCLRMPRCAVRSIIGQYW